MKKAELLALGLTEDQAVAVETASEKELKDYVPYSRFKDVNDEKNTLKESLKDRDKQIDDLKNSTDIDGLKKQIEELQSANTKKDKEHEAAIKAIRIETALDAALTGAKAKNAKAVKALLDLENADLAKDGTIKGLSEQITKLVEGEDTSFLFESTETQKPVMKGAKPADVGVQKPGTKVDFTKMNYEELAAYMDANPGASVSDKIE